MKKIAIILSALLSVVSTVFAQEGLKVVTPLFLATDVPEEEVSVITDYFISKYAFAVKGKAEVIDRDSFDMLVEEHNFQSNDWASKEGRSQLEMLNASHLVRGKLSKFRSQLVVTIKLIDVKTGVVYATYEDRIADVEELFDKMPEICEKLAEQIGDISIKKDEPVKKSDSMTAVNTTLNDESKQKNNEQKQEKKANSFPKYNLGDTGPGGGTIYYIETTSEYISYYEFVDFNEKKTYDEAKSICRNYRGGGFDNWYLPYYDMEKIVALKNNKLKNGEYWTFQSSNPWKADYMRAFTIGRIQGYSNVSESRKLRFVAVHGVRYTFD